MALRTWVLPALAKATLEDPNDETLGWTVQSTAGPTHLHAYSPYKYTLARTDAVAGTTNASATVTDASILASDLGRLVTGAGIPVGSYVGTVTAGVSFLLSSSPNVQANVNATATASVPIAVYNQTYRWFGTIPTTVPTLPTVSTSTSGGTLPTGTTYTYTYAWTTDRGESLQSATNVVTTGAGATNSNTVTPPALPSWATGVNIYGRVAGTQRLLQNQATSAAWVDTGAVAATGRAHAGLNEALALVTH